MIKLKTGALAVLAVYAGMRAAGKPHREAEAFSLIFAESGAGFQIIDDVKNITVGNAGKKRGDDIVEGKKACRLFSTLKNILRMPPSSLRFLHRQSRKESTPQRLNVLLGY